MSTRYRSFDQYFTVRLSIVSDDRRRSTLSLVRCSVECFPRFFDAIRMCELDRRGLCCDAVLFLSIDRDLRSQSP